MKDRNALLLGALLLATMSIPATAQEVKFSHTVVVKRVVPHSVAFSPDGQYLAIAGTTGDFDFDQSTGQTFNMQLQNPKEILLLVDAKSSKVKRELDRESVKGLPGFLGARRNPMMFSADGQTLFTFTNSSIRTWNVKKGKPVATWGQDFSKIVYSPSGSHALARRSDGKYEALNMQDGRSVGVFESKDEGELLLMDAEHPYVAMLKEGNIALKNLKSGEVTMMGACAGKKLTGAAFSHVARRLAVTSDTGAFSLWDFPAKTKLAEQAGSGKSASLPTFSPDDSMVLYEVEGQVRVWGSAGPGAIFEPKHVFSLRDVAFAADSRRFATIGSMIDPVIKVWEVVPTAK